MKRSLYLLFCITICILNNTTPASAQASLGFELALASQWEAGAVHLQWNTAYLAPVDRVIVYRQVGNSPLLVYRFLAGDTPYEEPSLYQFRDEVVDSADTYWYRIQLRYKDGTYSEVSEKIRVDITLCQRERQRLRHSTNYSDHDQTSQTVTSPQRVSPKSHPHHIR